MNWIIGVFRLYCQGDGGAIAWSEAAVRASACDSLQLVPAPARPEEVSDFAGATGKT